MFYLPSALLSLTLLFGAAEMSRIPDNVYELLKGKKIVAKTAKSKYRGKLMVFDRRTVTLIADDGRVLVLKRWSVKGLQIQQTKPPVRPTPRPLPPPAARVATVAAKATPKEQPKPPAKRTPQEKPASCDENSNKYIFLCGDWVFGQMGVGPYTYVRFIVKDKQLQAFKLKKQASGYSVEPNAKLLLAGLAWNQGKSRWEGGMAALATDQKKPIYKVQFGSGSDFAVVHLERPTPNQVVMRRGFFERNILKPKKTRTLAQAEPQAKNVADDDDDDGGSNQSTQTPPAPTPAAAVTKTRASRKGGFAIAAEFGLGVPGGGPIWDFSALFVGRNFLFKLGVQAPHMFHANLFFSPSFGSGPHAFDLAIDLANLYIFVANDTPLVLWGPSIEMGYRFFEKRKMFFRSVAFFQVLGGAETGFLGWQAGIRVAIGFSTS